MHLKEILTIELKHPHVPSMMAFSSAPKVTYKFHLCLAFLTLNKLCILHVGYCTSEISLRIFCDPMKQVGCPFYK